MHHELLQIDTIKDETVLHKVDLPQWNIYWERTFGHGRQGPGYQLELWDGKEPGSYHIALFRTNHQNPERSGNVTADWGVWSMKVHVDIEGHLESCDRIVARFFPPRDLGKEPFHYYRAVYRYDTHDSLAVLSSITKMEGSYVAQDDVSTIGKPVQFSEGELPVARRAFPVEFAVEPFLLRYIYDSNFSAEQISSNSFPAAA